MIGNKRQIEQFLFSQSEDAKFEIKEYKERRGLQANKYYWSLVNELANVLQISKEDLHFHLLKEYGQFEFFSVDSKVDMTKYVKYSQEVGESILKGKLFKHYKVFKGSSEMDSKEFSILLNGLIQECKQQDIETLDEKDIKELMKDYDSRS